MKEKPANRVFKTSIFVLLMTVLCLAFAMTASAETTDDGYIYTINNGEVTITGYEGTETDLVIPNEIGGCPVISIGNSAFKFCTGLTSVTIPDGVTSIGIYAFAECRALKYINIPDSVETIGEYAFDCCVNVENIHIPQSLKVINSGTFNACKMPEKLVIPDNIETICSGAFSNCCSLEEVCISSSVTTIETEAFSDCYLLKKIDVDYENSNYSSDDCGVLFNKDKTTLIKYPMGHERIYYTIPNSVKKISEFAFSGSFKIKKITLSSSLEFICNSAFYACVNLNEISFPATLKSIGNEAFFLCVSLDNIILPNSLTSIGDGAFSDCMSLSNVTIKGTETHFENAAICSKIFDLKENISLDYFIELTIDLFTCIDPNESLLIGEKWENLFVFLDDIQYNNAATIICHSGSTAEAYAKENGINYETVHFFGDWVYDWDNLFREHTCTICDYSEKESLEKETDGDVEIIKPSDPDKDFEVNEIEKNGSQYIVIEESFRHHHYGRYDIVRAFDITLKNKDGVHVQPDGTVKVKLPCDWRKNGVYKVYRVNDDGTFTDMNAHREGSHLVFDTNHFSVYVIVDESGEQPDTDDSGDNTSSNAFSAFWNKIKSLFQIIIEFFKSLGRK